MKEFILLRFSFGRFPSTQYCGHPYLLQKKCHLGLNGAWNGAWDRAWDQAWDQAWNWNRAWNGALSRLSYLSNFSKLVPGNGPWEWSLGIVPGNGPWERSLGIVPGNIP